MGFASFVSSVLQPALLPAVEANVVPDWIVRAGIRSMLSGMLESLDRGSHEANVAAKMAYVADLRTRGLAEVPAKANEQHYEVPAEFYSLVMGQYKKYSCGVWPADKPGMTLDESEAAALELVCERAQLTDSGLRVLDMGCGWGSFTLFAAAKYPKNTFVSVSNSNSQREYIMGQAAARGLANVNVITCDINAFEPPGAGTFDRLVSIEMMEHVKNYEQLLSRVSTWLKPGGKMFVHIFTHKSLPFHYTDGWMAEQFFSGGQMPSDDLLLHFQAHLALEDHWALNGTHYQKTCEAWLAKMDAHKAEALAVMEKVYGPKEKLKRYVNWRLFFIACAELFGYRGGDEWMVSHYRFVNKRKD